MPENQAKTSRFLQTVKIFERELKPDCSIVEVGSHDASFRSLFTSQRWTTVDKYGEPDVRCDFNGPNVVLPLEDNIFDAAICTEVLEHLPMGGPLVSELYRVLRPGGALYASVPNLVSLSCRLKWVAGRVPHMAASGDCGHPLGGTGVEVDGNWVAAHVVDFNVERFGAYLERAGFTIETFFPMGASAGPFKLPPMLTPKVLADFVFAKAVKPSD